MASVTADYSEITKSLGYMFSEILSASNSISFFQSLAFGIIAMVLVGGSWCFVGYIMGKAPKNNIDTNVKTNINKINSLFFTKNHLLSSL